MAGKKRRKIRGTDGDDELIGTKKKNKLYGYDGDDVIDGGAGGKNKAWGGNGADTFVTRDAKGYLKIMDFEIGKDLIEFCGCASTRIEMRGDNAWILKGSNVKAVVMGVDESDLTLDFANRIIF